MLNKMKEELFIMPSELVTFKASHPEYNHFEEVKNKYGEVAGYNCSVVEEKEDK